MKTRIIELARELVATFEVTTPIAPLAHELEPVAGSPVGVATAAGRSVQLSADTKERLDVLLRTTEHAAASDIVPRLLEFISEAHPSGERATAAPGLNARQTGTRQTWTNQIQNQVVEPLCVFYPTSLNDVADASSVVAILQRAVSTGCVVKAAGSGHSYSDVATTPDFFVNTHGLDRVANLEQPIAGQLSAAELRSPLPLAVRPIDWPSYDPERQRALFETQAGITIAALNTALEQRNLGLCNMGGYDGQTILGAISTSTHGSGITLGPFPDMVRSLVLATTGKWTGKTFGGSDAQGGVYLYRIEPTDGITDPSKYHDAAIQLIQDDECFRSAICSMGCFGIVYSVVLEVMQMYWLEENRNLTTLDQVLALLQPNPANPGQLPDALLQTRNLEVLVHPYPLQGGKVVEMDPALPPETYYPYFQCLITRRNIVPRPDNPFGRKGHRDVISQLLAQFKISFEVLIAFLNLFPEFVPEVISLSLQGLVDQGYVNKSFDIYNLGLNQDAGFATEIGFSLSDGAGNFTPKNFQAAIDRIHRVGQLARQQGDQYQTSAFSLRFVAASQAHLSMMQGVSTAMIEMDMVTGTYAGPEVMQRYQTAMYSLGGRPHWGLEFDHLTGSNRLISRMYPNLENWLSAYQQFNRQGTFNNAFTDRVGFTLVPFDR